MHNGVQYDPIQGQGHAPFRTGNPAVFNSCLLCHLLWELFLCYVTLKLVHVSCEASTISLSRG